PRPSGRAVGDRPRRGLGGLVLRDRRSDDARSPRDALLATLGRALRRGAGVELMSETTIRIPTPLRSFTKGADEGRVRASSVQEALANLGERCPGILERVLDKDGKVRAFVNVYVGSSDVRSLQGLQTPLADGAVLSIVPAVAGGSR